MPRPDILKPEQFDRAARVLTKRVIHRRMSYSLAHDFLLLQRSGHNYDRLEEAEAEAERALGEWISRFEAGSIRTWRHG